MKKYAYQPMNATEFFLHEIARNTEEIAELLKANRPVEVSDVMEGVEKEIAQIIPEVVEEVKVEEEVKPAPKRKRSPRKV